MQSQNLKSIDGVLTFNTLNHVKIHLKLIGCHPIASNRFGFLCNLIYIGVIFAVLISYSISSLTFLLFNAKTFVDFMESTFWASRSVLSLAVYTTLVWHQNDLAKILGHVDKIVHSRRKKQSIIELYDHAEQHASSLAKRINIHTFILSPTFYAVPIIWKSCYNYIIFGNSANTFQLFYPTR